AATDGSSTRAARGADESEAGAAAAAARTGRDVRTRRFEGQRAQPAMALGIVLAERPHLPELAAGEHACMGSRLRDDPRADASSAHGSLEEVLEARRAGLPGVRSRPSVAAPERSLAVAFEPSNREPRTLNPEPGTCPPDRIRRRHASCEPNRRQRRG